MERALEHRLAAAVATLRADAATLQAGRALLDAGVDVLLLKGPTIAHWLYENPDDRFYGDSDLLVAEHQRRQAEAILAGLGYEHRSGIQPTAPVGIDHHAEPWDRSADGSGIDLHRTLMGVSAPPERVFDVLYSRRVPFTVHGSDIFALDPAARALYVAMHASQHAGIKGTPRRDLELAVERVDLETWREAVSVARLLGAEPSLAAGLRTLPEGLALAETLELPVDLPAIETMRAEGRRGIHTLWRIETTESRRAKLRLMLREAFVTPREMREREGLRTRRDLARAYRRRFVHALRTLVRYWRLKRRRGR